MGLFGFAWIVGLVAAIINVEGADVRGRILTVGASGRIQKSEDMVRKVPKSTPSSLTQAIPGAVLENVHDDGKKIELKWPVTLAMLESAAEDNAKDIRIAVPSGDGSEAGHLIDTFLTARLEWRGHFGFINGRKSLWSLRRVPAKRRVLLEALGRMQFQASQHDTYCNASISVSGQWIGAAMGDLSHGFARWLREEPNTSFVPIFTAALHTQPYLFSPFCDAPGQRPAGDERGKLHGPYPLQDCYFLPATSCVMGVDQWNKIQAALKLFGQLKSEQIMLPHSLAAIPLTLKRLAQDADVDVLYSMLFNRLNARTQQELATREQEWRAMNPAWPQKTTGKSKCVGMHVRHGDKLTDSELHRGDSASYNRSLNEYLDHAIHLLRANGVSKSRPLVMLMSDDKDIMDDSAKIGRAKFFHVDALRPLHSTKAVKAGQANGQNNASFGYGDSDSHEMLSWLLTIRLMSVCDFFVANLNSGFSSFVFRNICVERDGSCPRAVTLGTRHGPNSELFDQVTVSVDHKNN